jgi:pyruvate dehydrogenase E1 component
MWTRCSYSEALTVARRASEAFVAAINQVPSTSLGVTQFGQSGSLEEVYRYYGIGADGIVHVGLDVGRG